MDGMTIQFKTTPAFDQGIASLIHLAGLNARDVIEKESGELIKTLVRISPPENPAGTKEKIKTNVSGKFSRLSDTGANFENVDSKESKTGLKYYAASSKFLFAGARDNDMRKSSQADLLRVYYATKHVQRHARIVVPFTNRRTSQRIAILTKTVTSKSQVNELVKRIQSHVGRLKAGWMVAVWQGAIKLRGAFLPTNVVTRHREGARGNYVNGLNTENNPRFTIINTSKGVTGRTSKFLIKRAMEIRSAAMQKNALLFMSGKKYISDYTKGKVFKID